MGKLIGLYAIVALGLGVATVLFMWVTGFFGIGDSIGDSLGGSGAGFEAVAGAVFGGAIAVLVVVVAFALGIVLAAIVGVQAARGVSAKGEATMVAAVSSGIGYAALVFILGTIVWAAFNVAIGDIGSAGGGASEAAAAQCRETFGADSPVCRDLEAQPTTGAGDADFAFPVATLLKGCVGAFPAALVGAASAALLHPRRRTTEEPL